MPYWVLRSRSVIIADRQPTPRMRSPSQCPACCLVSTSVGRWSIMVLSCTAAPCPERVSQRDFRIRRPVRSLRQ